MFRTQRPRCLLPERLAARFGAMSPCLGGPRAAARRFFRGLAVCAAALALLAGCAKRPRARTPVTPSAAWTETGIASWYGHPYHGRRAASGEIYDMNQLTAAHCTLPLGAQVRVVNLDNRRRVSVRINDRGPFVEGRIIDLSRAAARRLDMLAPGTARVRLEVAALPASLAACCFAVQIGAFRERANAERQREAAERERRPAWLEWRDGDPPLWRVLVGRETSLEAAQELARRLRARFGAAFVMRVDAPSPAL